MDGQQPKPTQHSKSCAMGSASSLVATQREETTKVNHNRNCVLNRLRISAAAFLLVVVQLTFSPVSADEADAVISVAEAYQDLDDLQRQLEQRFSYKTANGIDVDAAISRAKREITGPISVSAFSDRLAQIIALAKKSIFSSTLEMQ